MIRWITISVACLAAVTLLGSSSSAFSITRHRSPSRLLSLKHHWQPTEETRAEHVNESNNVLSRLKQTAFLALLSFSLTVSSPVHAANYNSLSDEQKVVAEAWRVVDNSFLDRTFNGVDWFQLRQDVVGKKYKTMEDAQKSIQAMIQQLGDKYTRYLPPASYQSLVDAATGSLAGVGVEISVNADGDLIASDTQPGSPADAAGIQPKDIFVQVDGTDFDRSMTPDDVAIKLRGPPGSKVGIVMKRNGEILDFIVTRQPIQIKTVSSYTTNVGGGVGKVGVIRVKSFSGTTAEAVESEWTNLKKKGAKALVFDLRGNPGGLLPGGVGTASLFLDADKPVVYVVDRRGVVDNQATLSDGIDLDSPVVLLVDGNTASAAEVFTGALQENGRATVVGERTFGKGIIQTVRPLSNNQGGVAVTIARYETPQHHDINKRGIPVDVTASVDCPKDDASACLPPAAFRKPQET